MRLIGALGRGDEKTYRVVPFEVAPGVGALEIVYTWTPIHDTVLDLGVWDEHGYRGAEGFRGWSGNRHGVAHVGHDPVRIGPGEATRCYRPGPIGAGTWHIEIGAGSVAADGASYEVTVRAVDPGTQPVRMPDPVDPAHVAGASPGWHHADLHQHGRHSHPHAPDWDELVAASRAAGLDVLPIIEYVVGHHWDELGAVQRSNPDLLILPGREVITYFGHAVALGETPGLVEYRHGFEDITIGGIQHDAVAAGALFGVPHATIYPEDEWGSYCRGCYFSLGDDIDWDAVDLFEVVTLSSWIESPGIENPFVPTAIDQWHEHLRAGRRLTAVGGTDAKLVVDYGTCATAIYTPELSRPAILDALRVGRAYVKARGVVASPELELRAATNAGATATFGGTVAADAADVEVVVRRGVGQVVRVLRDGIEVDRVDVDTDDFTFGFTASRSTGSGPLGTFWGLETHDERGLTALANPVFLTGDGDSV